jgi:hypothetical protein
MGEKNISEAMMKAAQKVAEMLPAHLADPKNDPRLVLLRQLHAFNHDALNRTRDAYYATHRAKLAAEAAFVETKELVEQQKAVLGLCGSFTCFNPLDESDGDYCRECVVARENV